MAIPAVYGMPQAGATPRDAVSGIVRPTVYPAVEGAYGIPSGRGLYHRVVMRTPGLVNYWPMDEKSGLNLPFIDRFGGLDFNTNPGGVTNAAGLVPNDPAQFSSVFSAAGTAYTSTTNYNTILPAPNNLSLELWVIFGANSNSSPAGCWTGAGFMIFHGTSVSANLRWYTGGGSLDGPPPVAGKVYHLVGTWDGTDRRLYVDGRLYAGPTAGLAIVMPALPFQVAGYNGNSLFFNGTVGNVAVYNRTLTDPEVWAHFAAGQL